MRRFLAAMLALALVVAACSGNGDDGSGGGGGEPRSTTAPQAVASGELGAGVTAESVKIAVSLVDFECIEDFVDEIRVDQEETYQAFIDEVNETGGINGRTLDAVFETYCPIPGSEPSSLTICTSATEDAQVFAIVGIFVDFTGDAQLCVTRDHERILITHGLAQPWIDEAPPALLLSPDITTERRLQVILSLLRREGTLEGRKVAVLAEENSAYRIEETIEPELEQMAVERGSDGVLTITGSDTTAAQAQLETFIEKWKSEGLGALVIMGATTVAKQFVEKIKAELPDLLLVSDNTSMIGQAQDYVASGAASNPYEGMITAEGETGTEHAAGEEAKRCRDIYTRHTGIEVPGPSDIVEGPRGKRNDIYGAVSDACAEITMFVDLATAVGPDLNNENWRATVDSMGSLRIASTKYASLGPGKYDADDTYRLVEFDSSEGESGDWSGLTPVRDVADL